MINYESMDYYLKFNEILILTKNVLPVQCTLQLLVIFFLLCIRWSDSAPVDNIIFSIWRTMRYKRNADCSFVPIFADIWNRSHNFWAPLDGTRFLVFCFPDEQNSSNDGPVRNNSLKIMFDYKLWYLILHCLDYAENIKCAETRFSVGCPPFRHCHAGERLEISSFLSPYLALVNCVFRCKILNINYRSMCWIKYEKWVLRRNSGTHLSLNILGNC